MQQLVVVVEDEADILQLLTDVLEAEGYRAVGVDRPSLVLSVARQEKPDLFVIDLMLPEISGIELAQELREQSFSRTPMIAMSASTLMVNVARQSGFFRATVAKPFDFDELMGQVARLLDESGEEIG
jgi:DNA-binding response OmpR family regulator